MVTLVGSVIVSVPSILMVLFVLSTSTALLTVTKPSPQMLVDALDVSDGVALVLSDNLFTAFSVDELSIDIAEFVLPTAMAVEIPLFSPDAVPLFFVFVESLGSLTSV